MPQVGIVMGSDSDMPVMAKAAGILDELGISYEMRIISAHREPDEFFEYARTAEDKGFKVIIAGAGMAAHLPGMCAAIFPLPVIGVPCKGGALDGLDDAVGRCGDDLEPLRDVLDGLVMERVDHGRGLAEGLRQERAFRDLDGVCPIGAAGGALAVLDVTILHL